MSLTPPNMFYVGGPVVPLFLVTCMTCGYTAFVNALVAGVWDRPSERPEAKAGHE